MACNLQQQIIDTYYNDYKFFFSKPNVEGIGFGYKSVNGIFTGEPCILVFVETKVPKYLLPNNGLIPTFYKGIKTDVIESGAFSTLPSDIPTTNEPPEYTARVRPLQPGFCISLAVPSSPATFGYIVTDNEQISRTYCLLSNTDGLARKGYAQPGAEIVEPARNFGGTLPNDLVARLLRYVPVKTSSSMPNALRDFNLVDAAIASYVNVGEVQLLNPIIPGMGVPRGRSTPALLKSIQWTGFVAGNQKGTIFSLSSILKVRYRVFQDAYFKDVVLSTGPLCFPGDFGALVCDINKAPMGMLFARSVKPNPLLNAFSTIANVESELKVTLLSLQN